VDFHSSSETSNRDMILLPDYFDRTALNRLRQVRIRDGVTMVGFLAVSAHGLNVKTAAIQEMLH
jgi:hypothetical protein